MSVVWDPDIVVSEGDFRDFRDRVLIMREKFARRGRGTMADCAHSLRINPSRMSTLMTARAYDPGLMDRVERWMAEEEIFHPAFQEESEESSLSHSDLALASA